MNDRQKIERAAATICDSHLPLDVLQAIGVIKTILGDKRATLKEVILAGYDQVAPKPAADPDAAARAVAIEAARRSALTEKTRIPEDHFHATSELVHQKMLAEGRPMVTVVLRFPQDDKFKSLACNAFGAMAERIKALTETTEKDATFKVRVSPPKPGTTYPPTVSSFEVARAGP